MRQLPSIELELLLRCSRSHILPENGQRIATLLDQSFDWNLVLTWAQRHGLNTLLFRTLRGLYQPKVPASIFDALRVKCDTIRFRNLVLARELHRVLHALAAAGVTATPYKGPALSFFLYRDLGLRESADIDLLIRPGDASKVRRVLLDHGFIPKERLSAAFERLYIQFHSDFSFSALEGKLLLEVNWRIVPAYWCLPEVPDAAWHRLGFLRLMGRDVPWFAPEDVLFVLCLHACKHKWESIKWIVDVAELVFGQRQMDWKYLTACAQDTGARRMLGLGLFLASDLLDAPVPNEAMDAVRRDVSIFHLADQVYDKIFAPSSGPIGTTEGLAFVAQASESYATKFCCATLIPAYFLLHRVARPTMRLLRRRERARAAEMVARSE